MTLAAPPGFLVGDGHSAASRSRGRMRKYGWLATVLGVFIAVLVLLVVTQVPSSTTPLSIANADDNGTRALAEVLRDHGVKVTEVSQLADVTGAAGEGGTLVVASYGYLEYGQLRSILAWEGPVVWLAPQTYDLTTIESTLDLASPGSEVELHATCDNTFAQRAQTLVAPGNRLLTLGEARGVQLCFGTVTGGSVAAVIDRDGMEPMTVIAAPSFLTNELLDRAGNASFGFNLLGTQPRLAWYTGSDFDSTRIGGEESAGTVLSAPDWMNTAMLAAALAVLLAAVWKGRRFGPLMQEPLPVIVHAAEATKGRARLYRRGGSVGHAAAALRAGASARLAARLGLGPASGRAEIVGAVAAASGRPSADVDVLLYGPPPSGEGAMLELVRRLDALEREVDPT